MPEKYTAVIGATLIAGLIALVAIKHPLISLVFAIVIWFPAWLLAITLRKTVSMQMTFIVAALLGAVGIIAVYIFISDPVTWWRQDVLNPIISPILADPDLSAEQRDALKYTLESVAGIMTGIVSSAIVLSTLLGLFIARWWQALLNNPGGFKAEFQSLQLGKPFAIVTAGLMVLAFLSLGGISNMAKDMSIVMLALYMLQGIALVHAIVAGLSASIGWLVAFYVILLVAFPQVMALLAISGFVDTWVNFRKLIPNKKAS